MSGREIAMAEMVLSRATEFARSRAGGWRGYASVSDVARAAGVSKPTARKYMRACCEHGMAESIMFGVSSELFKIYGAMKG